ncbi:tail fiber assembly protein [Kosakonia sp. MUSA4]|uniref:tail fiber assembly protein n=1 Tax=Kosakonia sp. MUSA4 TaxID=2067958 RepID=UPI00159894CB|nr:tail fiber assembly protein [Kosakonia sp. MUSA4]QJT82040.1 phage tail protein [Kosakonia sp. MUSA4]
MLTAILDENRLATSAGEVTVYNYDATSREYLSTSVEYLAVGVGIPANAALDAPLSAKTGFAVCRNAAGQAWEYIHDARGETVYDTASGEQKQITELGNYPATATTLAPATPYDVWNGSAWVIDESAQKTALIAEAEQNKTQRLKTAKESISVWQTELQLGIISDDDKASLVKWLEYIKRVQAVDTANAPDISWPEQPQ